MICRSHPDTCGAPMPKTRPEFTGPTSTAHIATTDLCSCCFECSHSLIGACEVASGREGLGVERHTARLGQQSRAGGWKAAGTYTQQQQQQLSVIWAVHRVPVRCHAVCMHVRPEDLRDTLLWWTTVLRSSHKLSHRGSTNPRALAEACCRSSWSQKAISGLFLN